VLHGGGKLEGSAICEAPLQGAAFSKSLKAVLLMCGECPVQPDRGLAGYSFTYDNQGESCRTSQRQRI
jgi:hypothetical protein